MANLRCEPTPHLIYHTDVTLAIGDDARGGDGGGGRCENDQGS